MRGDSLRDFYAKTLAVVGLGLIAGAGAIVDYWPTGLRLPDASSPAIARITVQPLPQNLNQQVPSPLATEIRPAVPRVSAQHVRWPAFAPAPQVTPAATRPASPTMPEPATSEPEATSAQPVQELVPVDFTAPVSDWVSGLLAASALAPSALDASLALPEAPTGFISGALKKTKDSLVKTGVVTGGSIAGAFRGVVGAFKKVSPF